MPGVTKSTAWCSFILWSHHFWPLERPDIMVGTHKEENLSGSRKRDQSPLVPIDGLTLMM